MPLLYGKSLNSHNKLHQNVQQMHRQPQFYSLRNPILNEMTNTVTFKKSQAFSGCINFKSEVLKYIMIVTVYIYIYSSIYMATLMQLCKVLLAKCVAEKKQKIQDHFHFFAVLTFIISLQ